MNYFKRYAEYLRDNSKGYWFKRKLYGWGWTPAKWQGWLVIALFILGVFGLAVGIHKNSPDKQVVKHLVLPLIIMIIALIVICYKKGERLRWQWGIPKK